MPLVERLLTWAIADRVATHAPWTPTSTSSIVRAATRIRTKRTSNAHPTPRPQQAKSKALRSALAIAVTIVVAGVQRIRGT